MPWRVFKTYILPPSTCDNICIRLRIPNVCRNQYPLPTFSISITQIFITTRNRDSDFIEKCRAEQIGCPSTTDISQTYRLNVERFVSFHFWGKSLSVSCLRATFTAKFSMQLVNRDQHNSILRRLTLFSVQPAGVALGLAKRWK